MVTLHSIAISFPDLGSLTDFIYYPLLYVLSPTMNQLLIKVGIKPKCLYISTFTFFDFISLSLPLPLTLFLYLRYHFPSLSETFQWFIFLSFYLSVDSKNLIIQQIQICKFLDPILKSGNLMCSIPGMGKLKLVDHVIN